LLHCVKSILIMSRSNSNFFHNGIVLAVVCFVFFGHYGFAEKSLSKVHSNFYDYLTSDEFSCVISKRIFKAGSVSKDYPFEDAKSACLLSVTCDPIPGIAAKRVTAGSICLAEKGVCEEPIDCARRSAKDPTATLFGTRFMDITSTAKAANNKFNDHCWETAGKKGKRGTIQILSDGKIAEEACEYHYACKSRPQSTIVVCRTTSETVKVDGREEARAVCPQLNDCINGDLSLPGFTDKELKEMSEVEKDRVMRQYEEGIEKLTSSVSQVSSTLPRQSGTVSSAGSAPLHAPKK
jgi:hypothetical protein